MGAAQGGKASSIFLSFKRAAGKEKQPKRKKKKKNARYYYPGKSMVCKKRWL